MSSILVKPDNKEELRFLEQLLRKLGINPMILSDEDMADLGLSFLMKAADRLDVASEEEVMLKLKS